MSTLLTRKMTFLPHWRMYFRKRTSLSVKGRSAQATSDHCSTSPLTPNADLLMHDLSSNKVGMIHVLPNSISKLRAAMHPSGHSPCAGSLT